MDTSTYDIAYKHREIGGLLGRKIPDTSMADVARLS